MISFLSNCSFFLVVFLRLDSCGPREHTQNNSSSLKHIFIFQSLDLNHFEAILFALNLIIKLLLAKVMVALL